MHNFALPHSGAICDTVQSTDKQECIAFADILICQIDARVRKKIEEHDESLVAQVEEDWSNSGALNR